MKRILVIVLVVALIAIGVTCLLITPGCTMHVHFLEKHYHGEQPEQVLLETGGGDNKGLYEVSRDEGA